MKNALLLLLIQATLALSANSQSNMPKEKERAIRLLIDQYSEAREKRDTALLKRILSEDVDQLVSTGEWRNGIGAAVEGMLKSSATTPGTRTLTIDKMRSLGSNCVIVDCRYEIKNLDSTVRKMWSSFVVVLGKRNWKISAIRNMLPSEQ